METSSRSQDALDSLIKQASLALVPAVVKLDLTYACNQKCVHCCVVPERREDLSLEEIRVLFAEIADKGCLYLSLSGGEIFLRKDLPDILEEAQRCGFSLRLMTNGSLIPPEMIPRMRKYRVGEVDVSLYGDTAEVHESVTRVAGSFEKTVASIRRMREAGIRIKIGLIILKQNIHRFRQMVDLAESLGTTWNLDGSILRRFDGSEAPLAFQVPVSELADVVEYRERRMPDLKHMKEAWNREKWLEGVPCGAGRAMCTISPYGDVFPCSVMPMLAGNIREQSFAEIWDHSEVLKRVRAIRRRDLETCATCELAPFCVLCPGRSVLDNGSLTEPSLFRCSETAIHRDVYEKIYLEGGSCDEPRE
ncbi:MAG: radical SAM protein [Candidatus Eisenbacteria sp.]|nr:radical SAM protein [Candidatus Eisenbacteria bacterium]